MNDSGDKYDTKKYLPSALISNFIYNFDYNMNTYFPNSILAKGGAPAGNFFFQSSSTAYTFGALFKETLLSISLLCFSTTKYSLARYSDYCNIFRKSLDIFLIILSNRHSSVSFYCILSQCHIQDHHQDKSGCHPDRTDIGVFPRLCFWNQFFYHNIDHRPCCK